MLTIALLVFTFVNFKQILGANILLVTPVQSPSHHIWNKALAMGLVERDHNITMLTHESDSVDHPNFTIITMEGMYEELAANYTYFTMDGMGMLETISLWLHASTFIIGYDYKTIGFKHLISYPKEFKFDLIIFDAAIVRYMYCLIEHFNFPPTIGVVPFLLPATTSLAFGSYPLTAQDPYQMSEYSNRMSLRERAWNIVYTYTEIFYVNYIYGPREEALVKAHYPKTSHTLDEFERNISILLSNTDPFIDYPKSLPPNIIPVGGLHTHPAKPLPEKLSKIMNAAKHGVILFSLGTNVKSDKLAASVISDFLKAFSKLPQVVLWKFESDLKVDLPKNVIISKWMPQNDILGHPNIKLFITHCGALSSQEALYHGVPMIGIPFFADQLRNSNKLVLEKVAVKLDHQKLNLENIQASLMEVLKNDMFAKNAKKLSVKYRDQPQTPLERAVFWIEYIMRHGKAEHLVTPARDMPFYEFANYDVLSLFALLSFLCYMAIMLMITFCKFVVALLKYKSVPDRKVKTK